MTKPVVAEVALLTGDGRGDAAVGEIMEAEGDLEPLGGMHGAVDLDLA